MMRVITVFLLALGVGFILIPVADAKDKSNEAYSQLFLFHVDAGATWEPGEISLIKGKSQTSQCVPVRILGQESSQPLGSGKVCLAGQVQEAEGKSLWDVTVDMTFNTKDTTLVFFIPGATVINLSKSMDTPPRFDHIFIRGASRVGTNAVRSGTGKFRDAQGEVELGGLFVTKFNTEDSRETVSKYPYLGDIPILGSLFRSTSVQK